MELNREILKSSTKIRRRKIERFLSIFSLSTIVLLDVSIFLAQLDNFQIKRVDISGNKEVESAVLFQGVHNILLGKYFGIYPKSNFFIYPKDYISEAVIRVSTLESVQVARGGSTLYISVKEREPKYLWCGDLLQTEGNQPDGQAQGKRCYYVDGGGFSYSRAPDFSDHIFFEFYGGEKLGGYTGKNILPKNQFQDIVLLADELKKSVKEFISRDALVYGVDLKKNGDVDFLVHDGDDYWVIRSAISLGPLELAKKMNTAVSSPVFQDELKKHGSGILYLDLRFGRKVFYKFK